MRARRVRWLVVSLALLPVMADCGDGTAGPHLPDPDGDLRERFNLRALGEIPYPPDNGPVVARIALGRLLFSDPILSGEKDVACVTCHHPRFAFTDGRQFSAGVSGVGLGPDRSVSASRLTGRSIPLNARNSPTIFNAALNGDPTGRPTHVGFQFWDGRVQGLEEQARGPIMSRHEMAGDAYAAEVARDSVVARLRGLDEYVRLFHGAFPSEAARFPGPEIISMDTYGRAVAAYERELVTRNSPFDQYARGDDGALTPRQKRGLELFFTKANCAVCHGGAMFSDFGFHVLGVPQEGTGMAVIPGDDTGREEHTSSLADRHAFRTPTLRNTELTAPYMHGGVFDTLEEVVRFYNDGAKPRHPAVPDALLDPEVRAPLSLTNEEMRELVEFMKALTDPGTALDPVLLTVPASVPSGLTPVFGVRAR
ncbi:MAG: cytochrome-c peroxidase [Gemmatimonadota bacterium]